MSGIGLQGEVSQRSPDRSVLNRGIAVKEVVLRQKPVENG